MAFPKVAATSALADVTNKTTRDFPLPADIFAGQLLIAFIVMDDQPDTGTLTLVDPGEEWTLLADSADFGGFSLPATAKCTVAYKIAVGGETTLTVNSTNAEGCSCVVVRITDYDAATAPAFVLDAFGGAALDPVSLTVPWGAEDTLWITALAGNPGYSFAITPPAGYGPLIETHWNTDDGVSMAVATRELNAETENPGPFNWSASGHTARITMAIRPGTDGPGPLPFELRLSGGAENTDATVSIGGDESSELVAISLLDDVTYAQSQAGFADYRLIYVHNSHPTISGHAVAYVTGQLETGRAIALGAATEAAGETVDPIAEDTTAPDSVTFSAPTSLEEGVDLGTIDPGESKGLWVRRTVIAATASDPVNPWQVTVEVEALP